MTTKKQKQDNEYKTKQQLLDEIESSSKHITNLRRKIEALDAKPEGRWVPKKGEIYYYIDSYGEIYDTENYTSRNNEDPCDSAIIAHGNCFETKDICDYEGRRQGAMNRLRAWARAQNGDWKDDWKDVRQKYYLQFSPINESWVISKSIYFKDVEKIYFASYKLAKRCRDECADDWNILADLEGAE